MTSLVRYPVQVLAYAAFAATVGYFSFLPSYQYSATDTASVKVSLSHAANRVKPCVRLTPEEIAKLAPNMRREQTCERERLPLTLEVEMDDEVVLLLEAPPSGLWRDGPASIYERFEVAAGAHRITARLRDTARPEGWDYTRTENVVLEPGRYFTVTFNVGSGGFSFR